MDELRYYLMKRPLPPKRETVKSEIALDKERLIRRRGRTSFAPKKM